MDVAADQPLDLEELVDRRVGRQADDHGTEPRSIASTASTMVACVAVPPSPRVESAPHAFPSSRHRRSGLAVQEPGEEARRRTSRRRRSSPRVVVDRRGHRDLLARLRADRALLGRLDHDRPRPPDERSRAIASSTTEIRARLSASTSFGRNTSTSGSSVEQPAVPTRRPDPSSGRSTSSPRRPAPRGTGPAARARARAAGSTSSRGCAGSCRSRSASIIARRRSPIVPANVSIARSSRPDRTTVTPVGRSGTIATADVSTPCSCSSVAHEAAEQVVAHHARERDAQAQLGGARRRRWPRSRRSPTAHRRPDVPPARTPAPPNRRSGSRSGLASPSTRTSKPDMRGSVPGERRSCRRRRHARANYDGGMPRIVLVEGDITRPRRRRDRERGQHVAASGRRRRRRDHPGGGTRRARRPGTGHPRTRQPTAPDGRRRSRRSAARSRRGGSSTPPVRSTRDLRTTHACSRAATPSACASPISWVPRRSRSPPSRPACTGTRSTRPRRWRSRRSRRRAPRVEEVRFVLFDDRSLTAFETALSARGRR